MFKRSVRKTYTVTLYYDVYIYIYIYIYIYKVFGGRGQSRARWHRGRPGAFARLNTTFFSTWRRLATSASAPVACKKIIIIIRRRRGGRRRRLIIS